MIIKAKLSRLGQTKWWEWLVRFAFGGVVTAIAGVIAKEFGPVVGGLFLAFPGIFPAGVTLVERHEKEKKTEAGLPRHAARPQGRRGARRGSRRGLRGTACLRGRRVVARAALGGVADARHRGDRVDRCVGARLDLAI